MEEFVARARQLTDEERVAVAEARKAVDETFHAKAVIAGLEALAGRGDVYVHARRVVAGVHLSEQIEDEVARLVQLAIDDALLAMIGRDVLHPNHLRELYRPWR